VNEQQLPKSFVSELLDSQDRLYAYIVTLGVGPDEANDILQNTNVTLCQEANQFPEVKSFVGWACRIAYFEVLSSRKRRKRDNLLFDADLLERIAEDAPRYIENANLYQKFLNACLAELPETQREMLLKRYGPGVSPASIAEELGRPVGSIHQTLYRIRTTLMRCIRRKMGDEL
jgi:RNA polymerase sigma-70 factor, ECF subfamily